VREGRRENKNGNFRYEHGCICWEEEGKIEEKGRGNLLGGDYRICRTAKGNLPTLPLPSKAITHSNSA